MAERKVTVTINGEETVSTATESAGRSMGKFVSGLPDWVKGLAALKVAYDALSYVIGIVTGALGRARDFVMDSIGAYDRFAASQTKLSAQSKLTGISLGELNRIADDAREKFGLSTVTANDAATTVGKYAARAGDAAKANELLARALDLGAASGLTAAQTMEALEQGLRGQDEGFDKLLGKNPSALWKEYADANGLAVGKMDDTTKRLAEITALMDAGEKVAGAYSDRTESGAGAQDRLNNSLDEAKVAFGQAIQPARIFIVQGLTTLVDVGGRVVLAMGRVANAIAVIFTGAVELARSVVGGFTVAIGKLTGNKELEAWGAKQANAFGQFQTQLAKLEKKYLDNGTAATASAEKQVTATTRVKKTTEDADKAFDEYMKRQKAWWDLLSQTTNRYYEFLNKLPPEVRKAMDTTHVKELNDTLDTVRKSGDALIGAMRENGGLKPIFKDANTEVEKMGGALSNAAGGASDVLASFGALDGSSKAVLTNVGAIGSTVSQMAKSGLTFAGVAGLLGGVGSIVNTMMQGDAARRTLLNQNNVALSRLSKDIGGLKLNVTGEDLQKANTALQGQSFSTRISDFGSNFAQLVGLLGSQGLTVGDLERIGKEMGITLKDDKGNFQFSAVNQLIQGLGTVQLGRVGQGFGDQLEFFRNSQRVNGNEGPGSLQALVDFLRNVGGVRALDGIDVMNDPTGAVTALRGIFQQLGNGQGIGAEGLGRLTGSQFSDLLMEIIGSLTGGNTGGTGGVVTIPEVGGGTGGGLSVPTETIQSVIGAMHTNLGNILTLHTTLHERIAAATESSATSLQSIDTKMDTLIAVTGGTDRVDTALESQRFALAVQQGRGVQF